MGEKSNIFWNSTMNVTMNLLTDYMNILQLIFLNYFRKNCVVVFIL